MDGTAKTPSQSPEVAAFRRYYNHLLSNMDHPVKFAQFLFSKGIISSETKNAITSDEDVEGKRVLLDAAEHALVQASDREAMFRSLVEALRSVIYWFSDTCSSMTKFVDGEHINIYIVHKIN